MEKMMKNIIVAFCLVTLFCAELATSFGLSRTELRNLPTETNTDSETDNDILDKPPVPPMIQRRACNGFPCMYSHLGTKAGKASLYRTLAGFIDACFTDPSCDPGRRKRFDSMSSIHRLLNTPIRTRPENKQTS